MRVIKDIRVYRSSVENIDGNSLPDGFTNKELHCVIHRIVMKLREVGFSLGEFDHLFINLTTCAVTNKVALAERSLYRDYPWLRYYDVEISQFLYDSLGEKQSVIPVVEIIEQVIQKFFCTPEFDAATIGAYFSEALTQGENMLMKFREKRTDHVIASVYLRYLDSGQYEPLLRVTTTDDRLLFEKRLKRTLRLDAFGEIRISKKRITIIPRRNSFTKEMKPMLFDYSY